MRHIRDGTHPVVRHAINQYGCASDTVAFITYFFIVHALQIATAALDCTLDVVLGHVLLVSLVDSQTQPWVAVGITAAKPRRNGNFFDEPGKNLAAPCVLRRFLVLAI